MKKLGRPRKDPAEAVRWAATTSLDEKTFREMDALVELSGIRRASLFRKAVRELLDANRAAIDAVLHEENVES
jgi:metal-responsive CopG/Arc/MetJ family transcriptional regulator